MFDRKDFAAEAGEEQEYFGMLEEAIVAECTMKFAARIGVEAPFRKEVEAIKQIGNWAMEFSRRSGAPEEKIKLIEDELKYIPDPENRVRDVLAYSDDEGERSAYAAGMLNRLAEDKQMESFERYKERKMLYDLLDTLVEKSEGKFKDREGVFNEFARANFTGRYLPLARTIEGLLGEGSFRRTANEFASEKRAGEKSDPIRSPKP